jgi:HPt (histidine-containing phosphotransfer) domain-containing protein
MKPYLVKSSTWEGEMAVSSEQDTAQGAWTATALLARVGGDTEIARELVRLFINECPRMLEAVRNSVASRSAQEIRRSAHLLKGSVCNFTETGAASAALELEYIGREDRVDDAPAALARLEQELQALLPQLEAFETSVD